MNELTVFSNTEFGEIRTIMIDNEPWFVAKDVALLLGYKNTNQSVKDNTDEQDRRISPIVTPSGTQNMVIINESGLYDLIFGSHLPEAKKFKRWITSEVLPTLRKTGSYSITEQKQDSYMIEDPVERAKRWIEEQEEKKRLEQTVEEQKPKCDYFDNLVDSKLLTTFRDTAKEFHMPPQQFTKWLTDRGYIYRDNHNMIKPYEQYRRSGLFQMKDFSTPFGYSNVQTYITVKGKETFRLLMNIPETVGDSQ